MLAADRADDQQRLPPHARPAAVARSTQEAAVATTGRVTILRPLDVPCTKSLKSPGQNSERELTKGELMKLRLTLALAAAAVACVAFGGAASAHSARHPGQRYVFNG